MACAAAWAAVTGAAERGELRLAGMLPLTPGAAARWCWSGAWEFPVGGRYDLAAPGHDGSPPFGINRNISSSSSGGRHQGADLDSRRSGDVVRAAAHGLVVEADEGWNGGYGGCVVLAHRLAEGGIAYSVYSHLARGSLQVVPGDHVALGQPLGRVGQTGRASTPHLHFEVRVAGDPGERWERCRVVDPITFVSAHLPVRRDDDTPEAAWLGWAERAALVGAECRADQPLDHATWWNALARSARHDWDTVPSAPEALAERLAREGLTGDAARAGPERAMTWEDLAADLERAREAGVRLPPANWSAADQRAWSEQRFGGPEPLEHLARLKRRDGTPTVGDACLLLAALAGPAPGLDGTRRARRPGPARDAAPSPKPARQP